ncbi:MAG TPA: helix-turn-helix domain-containing protein [Micromonosporaceae bacterium]|nr:helix-turn-helix domain-containing protein [Micromonosporaceae bacterium]
MDQDRSADLSAVAALDEPTRRRLYYHVVHSREAVSRDEAAAALGLPRQTAAFHLDRLAKEGLLDVVYERRTGRSGPGAGRPAKLYRRSKNQISVSLPERRYDLAGRLLAQALEEADRSGESPRAVLERRAYEFGEQLGAATRPAADQGLDAALAVLGEHGFEPRRHGDAVLLLNCPFHALAQNHTEMVCGMNLSLLGGLLAGLGQPGLNARLAPADGQCCVRIDRQDPQ